MPVAPMNDDDLYSENQSLRRQLKAYLSQARANEQKMHRFQEQELRLISLNSLAKLVETIVYEYRASFELDMVTLALVDPTYEIRHILEDEGGLHKHPQLVFCESADKLDSLFGFGGTPILESYNAEEHQKLFPNSHQPPASIALLPLIRYGEMIGCLNLGSLREERFVKGSGTDFLQRLAAVVAICLENASNHERLKRVGLTDFLTAVNNRRFFDQRLMEEMTNCKRQGNSASCLLLDIDFFKKINDQYGHRAGDQVLKEFAALIRKQLRVSDILARYGGEEFVVLLVNTPSTVSVEIAERIRSELERHTIHLENGDTLYVTVSIGVALIDNRDNTRSAEEMGSTLVEQADQALYRAKNEGRNQVVCNGFCPIE